MIPESRTTRRGRIAGTLSAFPGVLTAVAALAALAGCASYDSVTQRIAQSITPYRITIVQGNFVSAEAAAQMRVGMSRAEVTQLLGTPLLADMFHPERWDYLFYFKRGSRSIVQQRDFVVNFDGDNVTSWSGGEDLPTNLELLADIDGDRTGKKAAPAKAAPNTGTVVSAAESAAATATANGPTVPDPTRSTSPTLGAATAALPPEPNAIAADAANRAVNALQAPSNAPSPSSNTAPRASSGLLGNVSSPPQQLQLHQATPPAPPALDNLPVGPTISSPGTGTLGGETPAPQSAPLAAPPNFAGASGGEENAAPSAVPLSPPPPPPAQSAPASPAAGNVAPPPSAQQGAPAATAPGAPGDGDDSAPPQDAGPAPALPDPSAAPGAN